MASPRGIGFADEAEKASDYIVSGISGMHFHVSAQRALHRNLVVSCCKRIMNNANVIVRLQPEKGNYEKSLENSPAATKEYSRYVRMFEGAHVCM
jgi:hypothetical protein